MLPKPGYTFQLPVYEGPLDLLLGLIERAELDITKIALAQITDQYLEYLRHVQERDIEDLASFLIIAARLIQIKSETLLPRPPLREPGEEDPGDALARQLVAYKKYKQVAIMLSKREEAGLRSYLRLSSPPLEIDPKLDLSGVTLDDLHQAMLDVLANIPDKPSIQRAVAMPKVQLKDKIIAIVQSLRSIGRLSFRNLVHNARSRLEIVVSFLAILELVKQNRVEAIQELHFGDIEITPGSEWNVDQELDFELEFDE
jgi:segregation and condensation protein A